MVAVVAGYVIYQLLHTWMSMHARYGVACMDELVLATMVGVCWVLLTAVILVEAVHERRQDRVRGAWVTLRRRASRAGAAVREDGMAPQA